MKKELTKASGKRLVLIRSDGRTPPEITLIITLHANYKSDASFSHNTD